MRRELTRVLQIMRFELTVEEPPYAFWEGMSPLERSRVITAAQVNARHDPELLTQVDEALARLRDDDQLREFSGVWPFETGYRLPPRDKPRIIFAEIYPSVVKLPADAGGRVKDSVQVEAIARRLACHDASDTLSDLFAAPATLEPGVRDRVEAEEGWILGVEPVPNRTARFHMTMVSR